LQRKAGRRLNLKLKTNLSLKFPVQKIKNILLTVINCGSVSISRSVPQMTQIIADKSYANICVISAICGIKFKMIYYSNNYFIAETKKLFYCGGIFITNNKFA
jgi:hypothetical protein